MTNEKQEWGEFSEWFDRINKNFEKEYPEKEEDEPEGSFQGVSLDGILDAFKCWMKQMEDAPITTWKEELSVRGFDFEYCSESSDSEVSESLWALLDALAGMRIFITNTDHLSERELYELLVDSFMVKSVAQIPFDHHTACRVDIVGSEVEDNPLNWLSYYASNRERMEWAKQNIGKPLPAAKEPPYPREDRLPNP
jgi:hypothetical protein